MDFDQLAEKYLAAINMDDRNQGHRIATEILREAASHLPKDNPNAMAWFTLALQDSKKKWFVAKLMSKVNPVPKALLEALVLAAMVESNPSSNKFFVLPCVKTFGREKVKEIMVKHANLPEVKEVNGYNQTNYWVSGENA